MADSEQPTFFRRVADRTDEAFSGQDYSILWAVRRAIYWIGVFFSALAARLNQSNNQAARAEAVEPDRVIVSRLPGSGDDISDDDEDGGE